MKNEIKYLEFLYFFFKNTDDAYTCMQGSKMHKLKSEKKLEANFLLYLPN